eukprot:603044-Amphidinium_carterae.2
MLASLVQAWQSSLSDNYCIRGIDFMNRASQLMPHLLSPVALHHRFKLRAPVLLHIIGMVLHAPPHRINSLASRLVNAYSFHHVEKGRQVAVSIRNSASWLLCAIWWQGWGAVFTRLFRIVKLSRFLRLLGLMRMLRVIKIINRCGHLSLYAQQISTYEYPSPVGYPLNGAFRLNYGERSIDMRRLPQKRNPDVTSVFTSQEHSKLGITQTRTFDEQAV